MATGLESPVATASSRRCTVARFAAGSFFGRVLVVAVGFVLVLVLLVGAIEVGGVDGAACGEPLLHAPSASVVPTNVKRSFRIEARLGSGAAYASSP